MKEKILACLCILNSLTFHDVYDGADIALFDDEAPAGVLHGVHAVDDLLDLSTLQVLHKVVVHDGTLDQVAGSEKMKSQEKKENY